MSAAETELDKIVERTQVIAKRADDALAEAQANLAKAKKIAAQAVAAKIRMARAHVLLRDLRSIRDDEPLTPALARYMDAAGQLTDDDLECE